ncbi:MAG: hypothetical protein AAF125_09805, partial [Chloroflexota bacterium]
NYLMEPDVAARFPEYTGIAFTNEAALETLPEAVFNDPNTYPSADLRANMFTQISIGPANDALYDEAWAEVRAAVEAASE